MNLCLTVVYENERRCSIGVRFPFGWGWDREVVSLCPRVTIPDGSVSGNSIFVVRQRIVVRLWRTAVIAWEYLDRVIPWRYVHATSMRGPHCARSRMLLWMFPTRMACWSTLCFKCYTVLHSCNNFHSLLCLLMKSHYFHSSLSRFVMMVLEHMEIKMLLAK